MLHAIVHVNIILKSQNQISHSDHSQQIQILKHEPTGARAGKHGANAKYGKMQVLLPVSSTENIEPVPSPFSLVLYSLISVSTRSPSTGCMFSRVWHLLRNRCHMGEHVTAGKRTDGFDWLRTGPVWCSRIVFFFNRAARYFLNQL